MSEGLLLVLLVGFCYRVTRLVTTDDLTAPIRERLTTRDGELTRPKLWTLLTCPWCFGFHVSLATVLTYHFAVAEFSAPWWLWVGTVASAVGIVSKLVDD